MHLSLRPIGVPVGLLTAAAILATLPACGQEAAPWSAIVSPDNSFSFMFLHGADTVLNLDMTGWGPNWAWMGISSNQKAAAGELTVSQPFVVNKGRGEVLQLSCRVSKAGPDSVAFRYDLRADKDVPLTELVAGFSTQESFRDGTAELTLADGKTASLPLSFGLIASEPATSKVTLRSAKAGDVTLTIDPACELHIDHGMRVKLAADTFPKGERTVTITVTTPGAMALVDTPAGVQRLMKPVAGPDWFAFTPANDNGPSVIGMENWLDKPAGKHGGVRRVGDHFQFEDGTPVKFWGVNLAYALCAPSKADADRTAARYAKYGINGVRFHKFTGGDGWNGIGDPNDATKMNPAGLDRMDYFASKLAEKGIYYGWSHTFGFHVRPANRGQLAAYDEIVKNLQGNTYGLINFAPDVQDLMIKMVVNLLKHKNPYTGKTYAHDPALSYIEVQNEDDIFFYTTTKAFNACPTYKKLFMQRFAAWLRDKYKTQDGLAAAWQGALKKGETLDAANIVPETNPWFMSDAHLPQTTDGERRRLLDTAAFFFATQNEFYSRFVKAVRDAGYEGPICGSPWQAPAMLPHYLDLKADYLAGWIDRHDYFGGGLGDTMLTHPGSGYLGAGLQQVVDRPFGLSEWIHVYPSLYSAEGPAIMAAYGLGLQGWDSSYEFQSTTAGPGFSPIVGSFPYGVWNADVPTQVGQYPALARMVMRGDVKQGDIISTRVVSDENLATGKFSFSDKVEQHGDIKTFGGSVPAEALAAGRCVVKFTQASAPSTFPDLSRYRKGSVLTSNTGQLAWDTSGKGFFTINTPGTKALVGFAQGKTVTLGGVKIGLDSPYASIFLTALDKSATLADAHSALLSVVARNCNTGCKVFTPTGKIIDNGKAPILLEPVKATVAITARKVTAVNILDDDGRRTGKTVPVRGGAFTVDGARDHALYYEVVF